MLNIDETLKNIYRTDGLPASFETAHKVLTLYFSDLDLTITNDRIVGESFSLAESICSDDDLTFGSCEASQLKITVANLEQDLSGHEFVLTQTVNDTYEMPLGKYKVHSCEKKNEQWFREIIAYDCMKNADIDVAVWYNSMYPTGNETYTLKELRESLLTYLGIPYEDETLPNDNMIVPKTIDTTQLSGREVLRQCVELNGAFGQINRYGKFYHKILEPAYGLYPSEDLYPDDNIYPVSEDDMSYTMPGTISDTTNTSICRLVKCEEYTVKEIDKLIVRTDENDIGAIVGEGDNAYIIQGNFLVFGKSAAELEEIAWNIYYNIARRPYTPYASENIGLPYIEPGDYLEFHNNVKGYVLQRTLTGIQALKDEIAAPGSQEREQNFGTNNEIIQIKGRLMRFKKDIEGIWINIEDLDRELSTEIEALAGKIVLKVNSEGKIGYVELGADPDTDLITFEIQADNINLNGYVGINNYVVITEDGKLHAVDGLFTGILTSSEFVGGVVRSDNYYSGVSGMMIDLYNGTLDTPKFYIGVDGKIKSVDGEIETSGTNGNVIIKDGKITLYNNLLQATAEINGSDMWVDYLIVNQTANFIGNVNFQLNYDPTLVINGVPQNFITSVNKQYYTFPPEAHSHSGYATTTDLANAVSAFNSAIDAIWTAIGN